MHYAKYGKTSVSAVLQHSDRGIDSPDTHNHSNEKRDRERTHLNYDLKDRGGLTAYQYHKQMIDGIAKETKERTGKGIRKDAVTLCSWVVTAPEDLPQDRQEDFFKGVYNWFAERYGEGNIVTAAVHRDETTPHMHFQFVPITEKDGVRRLCAKDMETPKTLKQVHVQLQKHLSEEMGIDVKLLNGATVNGNKTIQELKAQSLEQQNNISEKELRERQRELAGAEQELAAANANITKAAEQLGDILGKKQRASAIHKPNPIKDIFSKDKAETITVSRAAWSAADSIRVEMTNAAERAAQLEQAVTIREQKLAQKEQEIEPLHRQAERERKQAQRLVENAEQLISERATALAEQAIQAVPPEQRDRTQRMERFLQDIEYRDGTTALERFRESESRLTERVRATVKHKSGMER